LHWNAEKSDKPAKQNCTLWFWVKRRAHIDHRFRMTNATQIWYCRHAGCWAVDLQMNDKNCNGNDLNLSTVKCILAGSSFEQFPRYVGRIYYRSGAQPTVGIRFCMHPWFLLVVVESSFHGSIQRKFTFNQHNYNGFFTPITVNCKQSSFLLDRTLWAGSFIQNTYLHNQIEYKYFSSHQYL